MVIKTVTSKIPEKVLILGANGMLGSELFKTFVAENRFVTTGTIRTIKKCDWINYATSEQIIKDVDVTNITYVKELIEQHRPGFVINCIGVIKQKPEATDNELTIQLNSLFPHQLARICSSIGSRLIHISTDCVFSGTKGSYSEKDFPDAIDFYGKTKNLGEVIYGDHVTLRTSIIGHEIGSKKSLLEWFLSQQKKVYGYSKAIFSGFTTNELALIIHNLILPNRDLTGLFHVASSPISKLDLLKLIRTEYRHMIDIEPNVDIKINRSLSAVKFNNATGYTPPSWKELIYNMKQRR